MRKSSAPVVEIRKDGISPAARIERIETTLSHLEKNMQMHKAADLAAEARRLTLTGNRENVLKAGKLLEDEAVYAEFRAADARAAEEASRQPAAPVAKHGGVAVDDLIAKANSLREANPGLTMAQAMDRIAASDVTLAKRVDQELTVA
jgi:hypothetical protein